MTTGPDLSRFEAATRAMHKMADSMALANYATSKATRPLHRMYWTRGDRHIERIVQEILAGVPGRPAHIRLDAAVGLAEVLDRRG